MILRPFAKVLLALATVSAVASACSAERSVSAPRATATATRCEVGGSDIVNGVTAPADLRPSGDVALPTASVPRDPTTALLQVADSGMSKTVAVFRFGDQHVGSLVPKGASVETLKGTTGPNGIIGVASRKKGELYAAVMGRDVDAVVLGAILRASRNTDSSGGIAVGRFRTSLISYLSPSDVPGIGSIPVGSTRHGRVVSLTNDHHRSPEEPQRAAVVARYCPSPTDRGRLAILQWFYGVKADKASDGRSYSFRYPAPAGNGSVEVRVWESAPVVTIAAAYGLAHSEAEILFSSIDAKVK